MEENKKQDIEKPLTTDEIRLQAHKWTLASDVGLLAHLEQFSQNIFNRSQETQKKINSLLDSFEDTSTKIYNITNQFLALQNSQFVENRVYDDESPTEEYQGDIKVSKEEQEKHLLAQYKEAVEIGVKLLDSHFEEVQLPLNSDSDEEEVSVENSGLIWKPKNPYTNKRFPLLIGSAEWWADDNVGLGEYEENLNPDTLSSQSYSDMEAENDLEKRIRMSSSSSTESENIISKKPKEQISPDYEDIFAPRTKDMFRVQSNLFKEDIHTDVGDTHEPKNESEFSESVKQLNLPLVTNDENVIDNSCYDKREENSLFEDSENNSEPVDSVINTNRLPNAFTKELTAKLSNIANNAGNDTKLKNELRSNVVKKEHSALFGEVDDNDDLFSVKKPASNLLFKKQTIFTDTDQDDQLFRDSDSLFSRSNKPQIVKGNISITPEQNSNRGAAKENDNITHAEKAKKFAVVDDLFGNNDDLLFSGKTLFSPSQNSGGPETEWKDSQDVRFSTPYEIQRNKVPQADIVGSSGNRNFEGVSAVTTDPDNSLNSSHYLNSDTSNDYDFSKPSENSISRSGNPKAIDSPLTWTHHTQTQHALRGPHDSNNNQDRMGHTDKSHFSREQSEENKKKSIFTDEDEDDDLFQTNKSAKPLKDNSLFEHIGNDDLFSNLASGELKYQPVLNEEEGNSILFQKSLVPTSEIREEERSSSIDKVKQQDSVSMSSSRSSLFDDGGKSNLASVFDNDKPANISDSLFNKTDENIFGEKKSSDVDENDVEDLFSSSSATKHKGRDKGNVSLFDDLEDADDLFGDNLSKKLFERDKNHEDLFVKPNENPSSEMAKTYYGNESQISRVDEIDTGNRFDDDADDLFNDNREKIKKEENSSSADGKFAFAEGNVKNRKTAITDIFAELEDEDDDLFGNTKPKGSKSSDASVKNIVANKGVEREQISNIKLLDDNLEDDFFTVIPRKEKNGGGFASGAVKKEIGGIVAAGEPQSFGPENFEKIQHLKNLHEKDAVRENVLDGKKKSNFNNSNIKEGGSPLETGNLKSAHAVENTKSFDVDSNILVSSNRPFNENNKLSNDKSEDATRPIPPATLNIVKKLNTASKHDNNCEPDGQVQSSEKRKVIGKLSIPANLKINPMSLLPGAVAKKSTSERSNHSEEQIQPAQDVTFDNQTNSVPNLLKCLNKDRPKIQMRRRPQTRRARHEALRSSGIDFLDDVTQVSSVAARSKSVDDFEKGTVLSQAIKSNSDTNVSDSALVSSDSKVVENADSSSSIFHSIENSPEQFFSSPLLSNPLSPSTDEEDYFNVPELDLNFEREDQSIFKSNLADSKSEYKNDDTLLFDGAPVLSPMDPAKNIVSHENRTVEVNEMRIKTESVTENNIMNNIYNREPEIDGSLFVADKARTSRSQQKKPEVKSRTNNLFDDLDDGDSFLFQKKVDIIAARDVPTKSLFDHDDDDDDLFSEKPIPSDAFTKILNDPPVKNCVKSDIAEKPKQSFIDPLGLMGSPD